jgi:hypothetical protein
MSDEQQPIISGYIDVQRTKEIVEGELRRRAECEAGLRPWLVPPGTDPRWPKGLAGSTPEEAEQLANFEESIQRLRDAGEFPMPKDYFRPPK